MIKHVLTHKIFFIIATIIVVVVIVVVVLVGKEELVQSSVEPCRHLDHQRNNVHFEMLLDRDATHRSLELAQDS